MSIFGWSFFTGFTVLHLFSGSFGCLYLVLLSSNVLATTQQLTVKELEILRDNGITVVDTDQDTWTLEHHGLPDHGFTGGWGNNPNSATIQNYSFPIPKIASFQEVKGCVYLGPIAMSVNGVPFYNPYTGQGKNAVEGECQEDFDDCSGHPSPSGAYHYHKLPTCIYTHTPNQFLGVAFDGFPIYGPMDENGNNFTSVDLDECHGHWHNGRYMYRVTREFPYVLGCYSGSAPERPRGTGRPAGTGPGNGPQPPRRPGMRMKRASNYDSISETIYRARRQTDCRYQAYSDWQTNTCYAFCENPSTGSYDECTPPSRSGTTGPSTPTRPVTDGTTPPLEPSPTFPTTLRNDITTVSASNRWQVSSILALSVVLLRLCFG